MEASRKPLAKGEGRRRMPFSGLTIAWRGTPSSVVTAGTRPPGRVLPA